MPLKHPLASERTVERLILYRKRLSGVAAESKRFVYSYEIGALSGVTPSQVRRDLMCIGYSGNPNRGYDTNGLIESIEEFLYEPSSRSVVLVGAGNLGRAILAYFSDRHPRLSVVAAFDTDPAKIDRVILGCRCFPMTELASVARAHQVRVAIMTVPAAAAQDVADTLVEAGVKGLVNFAPTRLRTPQDVYVEDIDLALSLEKVSFFARQIIPVERKGV